VKKYNNNYFLNIDPNELQDIEEIIRPLRKVTKELLKKKINKNTKALTKKLSWTLKNIEQPFCAEFKQIFEENRFRTVNDAAQFAAKLYAANCEDYMKSKSTVTSENGIRQVKRRRFLIDNDDQLYMFQKPLNEAVPRSNVDDDDDELKKVRREICEQIRSKFLDELRVNLKTIISGKSTTNTTLNEDISSNAANLDDESESNGSHGNLSNSQCEETAVNTFSKHDEQLVGQCITLFLGSLNKAIDETI
jgi:hypothetical protein